MRSLVSVQRRAETDTDVYDHFLITEVRCGYSIISNFSMPHVVINVLILSLIIINYYYYYVLITIDRMINLQQINSTQQVQSSSI